MHGEEGWAAIEQPAGLIFYDRQMIKDGTGIKLKTDHGIYGPGTLVWHPEGYKGGHGATEEESCTFLFIGNKSFDISL